MKKILVFALVLQISQILVAQQNTISEIYRTDEPQLTISTVPNQTSANFDLSTNIPNVDAFLNDEYLGKTPLTTRNISPGVYKLRLEKQGYYERDFYITLNAGTNNVLYIELLRISGYVSLDIKTSEAQVYIDGKEEKGSLLELYEGTHTISVKKFGYKTYADTFTVVRNQTQDLFVDLEIADFSLTDLTTDSSHFNPNNPSSLGLARVEFEVSAEGEGIAIVLNEQDKQIREIELSPFTTWKQQVVWDGKNNKQEIVEDGAYTVLISASGLDGSKVLEKAISVTVDSSITYLMQKLTFLGGSFGSNPSPILFPQKTVAMAFSAGPAFSLDPSRFIQAPILFNVLVTPLSWLEVSGNFAFHINDRKIYAGSGGVSTKFGSSIDDFSYAGYVRYGYSNEPLLMAYSSSGLAGGATIGYRIAPLTISVYGEYVVGDEKGLFESFETNWNTGLSAHAQFRYFSTALWAKWMSSENISTGLDFSVIIPSTTIICNLGTDFIHNTALKQSAMAYSAGFTLLF